MSSMLVAYVDNGYLVGLASNASIKKDHLALRKSTLQNCWLSTQFVYVSIIFQFDPFYFLKFVFFTRGRNAFSLCVSLGEQ